jgi:hypothetical protein
VRAGGQGVGNGVRSKNVVSERVIRETLNNVIAAIKVVPALP